jgi:PD-(D/E)XK nuclease superfamily
METELPENLQLLSGCLEAWISAKEKLDCENKNHGTGFNPLSLIPINEKTHSKILGDLLKPHGTHGQGALFLNAFLSHLGVPNPEQGSWHVSVEEARVDVMLWRRDPASVILIENKAKGAVDQDNQLYRYWHENIYTWKPELNYQEADVQNNFKLIYMPADDNKCPSDQSLSRPDYLAEINTKYSKVPLKFERCTFGQIGEIFRLLSIPTSNERLRAFLDFYIEHWTT